MKVEQRKRGGALIRLSLAAETLGDRQRLAVILSDLGLAKVPAAEAVVVAGAGAVSSKRQILLYLRDAAKPVDFREIARACGLTPYSVRARLWELVAAGDVVTTGDERFVVAEPGRGEARRPVHSGGRPRNTNAKPGAR
jgi:hypothetical protein